MTYRRTKVGWLLFVAMAAGTGLRAQTAPHGCTVGIAMGNAVPDGRAICWKNRDFNYDPNRIHYKDDGAYAWIGLGAGYPMSGVNTAGLSIGNSVVSNMDTSGPKGNYQIQRWILDNCATVDQVRQAIITETSGVMDYWDDPSGCFVVIDARGNASLFEVGATEYFEYDPAHPDRLIQYPEQVAVRANVAHRNADHTDDAGTGGNRYTEARTNMINAARSGTGVTIEEMINDVSRFGEPGGVYQNSNDNTQSVTLTWGAAMGEDPRSATLFASCGQPDYCCFVPVWAIAGGSMSDRLTSGDSEGLAYQSWQLFDKDDGFNYDGYINSFYTELEMNFVEAAGMVRAHWNNHGFTGWWADRVSDEAAESAWRTMSTMVQGTGRALNETPVISTLDAVINGAVVTFDCVADDADGFIAAISWDFGDGAVAAGATVSHAYTLNGTYLLCCTVEDDDGSRNSRWELVTVTSATPACIVDNLDDRFETSGSGAWGESTAVDEFGGSSYYTNAEGAVAEWRPDIPEDGFYEVFGWWSARGSSGALYDRDDSAEYGVHHDAGTDVVVINQEQDPGQWVSLGTHPFHAGSSGYVSLTRVHDGDEGVATSADAVKWVKTGNFPTPVPTPTATPTVTPSPAITPTPVPFSIPKIMAAGYAELPDVAGGPLTLLAYVEDGDGLWDIGSVEVLYAGTPMGVQLSDDGTQGDYAAGDGIFGFSTLLPASPQSTRYLFEIRAMDRGGNESLVWPYLTITGDSLPVPGGENKWITEESKWSQGYMRGWGGIPHKSPLKTPITRGAGRDLGVCRETIAHELSPPQIILAGYWDTEITTAAGGVLTLVALVQDPDGLGDIASVEIIHQGVGTGILLLDDGGHADGAAGDGLFGFTATLNPGIPAGRYLFELIARDHAGNRSSPWPWLDIHR